MTDQNSQPINETPTSPSVDGETLIDRLKNMPLDQTHDKWPMTVRFRISETERDALVAALSRSGAPVAWRSTTPAFRQFITQETYDRFSPEARNWYEPFKCASCAAPSPDTRVREAAQYVLTRFKKDEADGYRSRDRQFAITILDSALSTLPQPAAVEPKFVKDQAHRNRISPSGGLTSVEAAKSPALDPATVEACAKVVDQWTADITKAGDQFDKGGDIYAHANISQGIAAAIRALTGKDGA